MGSSLTPGFNYVRLGEHTLTAPGSYLDVSNIPSGYKFLVCYVYYISTAGTAGVIMRLNNDNGANQYITQSLSAAIAVISSANDTNEFAKLITGVAAGTPSNLIINLNQSPLAGYKGFSSSGGIAGLMYNTSGYWKGVTEINRVTLESTTPNAFDIGCQMIIYGVR